MGKILKYEKKKKKKEREMEEEFSDKVQLVTGDNQV